MAIEQIMYFTLGFLIAGLVALIVLPSVWKRAVRLTKKRIEAATPITMAEFRADKDQLRAQYALHSRQLERNIDALRERLTSQLGDLNASKTELAIAKSELAKNQTIQRELVTRNETASARIVEMQKNIADISQRLRNRERDVTELQKSTRNNTPQNATSKHDDQAGKANASGQRSAIASIREALSLDKDTFDALDSINDAYSQISSAGKDLNALLGSEDNAPTSDSLLGQTLAEKLSQDDALNDLHTKITEVESSLLTNWASGKADKTDLRARLGNIASSVSSLVYAADSDSQKDKEESLFDRIRKFAADDLEPFTPDSTPTAPNSRTQNTPQNGTGVSDRMAAFRDIHANS